MGDLYCRVGTHNKLVPTGARVSGTLSLGIVPVKQTLSYITVGIALSAKRNKKRETKSLLSIPKVEYGR